MMKTRIISLLMVLVLSTQLFPLAQAGNNWYQNQLTEELPGNDDIPVEPTFSIDEISKYLYHSAAYNFNLSLITLPVYYNHTTAQPVPYPVMDVQTPPPDFFYI